MKKLTLKEISTYCKSQVEDFKTVLKDLKGSPVDKMVKSIWGTVVGKTACGLVAVIVTGTVIGTVPSSVGGSKALKMIQVPNELFYIQQTEVTKGLYKKIMGRDPGKNWQVNDDNIPVVYVSFMDAVEFCNRLSDKEGYEKAYSVSGDKVTWNKSASGYRLPTVEEWMYAAKGNEKFKYSGSDNLDEVAWFANSTLDKKSKIVRNKKWEKNNTLPGHTITSAQVGAKKKPNAYGIYDMTGNVEEICWNENDDGYKALTCGGSFVNSAEVLDLNNASAFIGANYATGFRVARNISDADFERILNVKKIPERNISMGATEVTQLVYEKVMGKNPASHKGRQFPVESVSWYDAIEFCNSLSQMYNLRPAYFVDDKKNVTWNQEADGYRLPTEAEWEFCSKGGKDFKYSGSDDIEEVAWYNKNSNGSVHPVAEKKANDYGLYDMSGNVFEWCWDPAFENESSSCDKGGSYKNKEDTCSITAEDSSGKKSKYTNLGIRLVRGKISDIDIKAGEEKIKRKNEMAEALFTQMLTMIKIPGKNVKTLETQKMEHISKMPGVSIRMEDSDFKYVGDFNMLKTEVTQHIYKRVMGENPSRHKGPDYPVENVSWGDAIYFCNKLSIREGLEPVYLVKETTDVTKWGYIPHKGATIGNVTQNTSANGYRLPTEEEWICAWKGGEGFKYSGSNNINEVGWGRENSGNETHTVALKKPNGYGLYDMDGNVSEWIWDIANAYGYAEKSHSRRSVCGISYKSDHRYSFSFVNNQMNDMGFRIVCSAK